MTRDDIISTAKEAGMSMDFHDQFSINHGYRNPDVDTLKKFAELCMATEREACIKLLEDFSQTQMVPVKDTWRMGLIAGANALRARGDRD